MARLKLQMPEFYPFKTTIDVRITDINYGNHLGNDALLSIIHEARVRFLKSLGYSETDIEGVGIIMADVAILYKSEAYYGERLTIHMSAGEFSRKSCDFFYRIRNESEKIVALCKTGIVFFNYQTKKTVSIPPEFLSKF